MKKYLIFFVFVICYELLPLKSYAILGDLKVYQFPRIGLTLNYFKDAIPIVNKNFKDGWAYFYALKSSTHNTYESDTILTQIMH